MTSAEINASSVQCHHCRASMKLSEFRKHRCVSNQHQLTSKQDWWVARDELLRAAGLPEAVYGYEVAYMTRTGSGTFRFAGTEAAARRAARLKRLFVQITEVQTYTYAQYCRAFGVPGSKM